MIDAPDIQESASTLSPCVIMINDNGVMQRCGTFEEKKQRKISNLIGTWKVDKQAVENAKITID